MSKKMILVDVDTLNTFGGGRGQAGPMPFNEVKAYKKLKKLLKEEEEEKKKNSPKKPEGKFLKDWSVGEKFAFFAIAGPPLGISYVFGLIIAVRMLASFVVGPM